MDELCIGFDAELLTGAAATAPRYVFPRNASIEYEKRRVAFVNTLRDPNEPITLGQIPLGVVSLRGVHAAMSQQRANVPYIHAGDKCFDCESVSKAMSPEVLDTRFAGDEIQSSPPVVGGRTGDRGPCPKANTRARIA